MRMSFGHIRCSPAEVCQSVSKVLKGSVYQAVSQNKSCLASHFTFFFLQSCKRNFLYSWVILRVASENITLCFVKFYYKELIILEESGNDDYGYSSHDWVIIFDSKWILRACLRVDILYIDIYVQLLALLFALSFCALNLCFLWAAKELQWTNDWQFRSLCKNKCLKTRVLCFTCFGCELFESFEIRCQVWGHWL